MSDWNFRPAVLIRLTCLSACLLVPLVVAGCDQPSGPPARWSTRAQSVVPTTNNPTVLTQPGSTGKTIEVRNESLHAAAIDVLRQASISDDALMRANAIEALQSSIEPLREAVLRGLVDHNEGVRFVSVMSIGRGNLCGVSHLLIPMLEDTSASVRAAVIFALSECGDDVDLNPLAEFITSSRPADRANTAMVLAELGNGSAIPLVRSGMGYDHHPYEDPARSRTVDLLMAESLVRLGDRAELEAIRAAIFAPPEHSEMTALACQMLARLGDKTVVPTLHDLAAGTGPRQAGPELRLVAAAALARIDPPKVPMDLVIEQMTSLSPGVRLQVANVLGAMGQTEYEPQLTILLHDEDPQVQIASASAILKLESQVAVR